MKEDELRDRAKMMYFRSLHPDSHPTQEEIDEGIEKYKELLKKHMNEDTPKSI